MERGDIRFVNNMAVMHRRDKYQDDLDRGEDGRRYLLRLWLHNPEKCWPLPPILKVAWERVFADKEREERWDILVTEEGSGKLMLKQIWKTDDDEEEELSPLREPDKSTRAPECD
jgi:hypothetical protein